MAIQPSADVGNSASKATDDLRDYHNLVRAAVDNYDDQATRSLRYQQFHIINSALLVIFSNWMANAKNLSQGDKTWLIDWFGPILARIATDRNDWNIGIQVNVSDVASRGIYLEADTCSQIQQQTALATLDALKK
ncbi:hypothetical protein [Rhizobium leucaenae]|uniref:Uncharacterized protein n=1 Tax=Rhizobium leucaenae TaxID=29450 RepID=A0A7W6ZX17_9HYPH|nr:hypothetical protein [Rhizobium leucaenae]MBB4570326.1 hypothetical protein [Rhizobium leucaenae]